jgi:general secretion pathway protein D
MGGYRRHSILTMVAIVATVSGCSPEQARPPDGLDLAPLVRTAPSGRPVEGVASPEPRQTGRARPIIELANGSSAARAAMPPAVGVRSTDGGAVLNFVNADVREVVRTVLGEMLRLNYVIDPGISGRITIQTSAPLARDAVLPMFERALQTNGIALLKSAATYRVVPLGAAARSGAAAVAVGSGGQPQAGYGIEIVPLKFASARRLRTVLEPFVPAGGVLQIDEPHNVLIVSGTGPQVEGFMRLVGIFDVDWLADMSYGLFPLQHGTAPAVARDLTSVFDSIGAGPTTDLVRIVPIERLNAILLASKQPDYIAKAQKWIERLDDGWDKNTPQIYVYHVQNSRAVDLAKVLESVFTASGQPPAGPRTIPGSVMTRIGGPAAEQPAAGAPEPGPIMPPPAISPTARGAAAVTAVAPAAETRRDQQAAAAGDPAVIPSGEGSPASAGANGTRIVADEKNNALVIYAQPRDYAMIEAAIKKLDILPPQVLIEATVAEVTLNSALRYGLQSFFKRGNNTVSLSQLATGAIQPIFPGFNYVLGAGSTQIVLDALSSMTHVQVLSAPQLMVLDHQTAMLQVGDEVPIAVQQARSVVNPDSPIVNSIELRNTGVILRVTPRVNVTGVTTLDIEQEVSDVTRTTTSDIDSPTIQQRRLRSVVAVGDGKTIALGGLIRSTRRHGKDGIPILSDIPVLDFFTSDTSDSEDRTELLILLTPHVLRDQDDATAVTEELRRRLSAVNFRLDGLR